jgi:hypothetical protein
VFKGNLLNMMSFAMPQYVAMHASNNSVGLYAANLFILETLLYPLNTIKTIW